MRILAPKRDAVTIASLIIIIVTATWVRLCRPAIGYAIAKTLSYYAYGGDVDHNLMETLIISAGGALLGGYISWIVMKDWEKIEAKFKRGTRKK